MVKTKNHNDKCKPYSYIERKLNRERKSNARVCLCVIGEDFSIKQKHISFLSSSTFSASYTDKTPCSLKTKTNGQWFLKYIYTC